MDDLSPESRTLYELLMTESSEEYEKRFAEYATSKLKSVSATVDSLRSTTALISPPTHYTTPLHGPAVVPASTPTRSTASVRAPSSSAKDCLTPAARRIYDYLVGDSATPASAVSEIFPVLQVPTVLDVAPIAADFNVSDLAAPSPTTCSTGCPSSDDSTSVCAIISSVTPILSTTTGHAALELAASVVCDEALPVDATGVVALPPTNCSTGCSDSDFGMSFPASVAPHAILTTTAAAGLLRPLPWPSFECSQVGTQLWYVHASEKISRSTPSCLLPAPAPALDMELTVRVGMLPCCLIAISACGDNPDADDMDMKDMFLTASEPTEKSTFLMAAEATPALSTLQMSTAHPLDTDGSWECVSLLQPKPPWSHLAPTSSTSELMSDLRTVFGSLHISDDSFELDMIGFAVCHMFCTRFNPGASFQAWVLSTPVGQIIQYGSLPRLPPCDMCLNLPTAATDSALVKYLRCKGPQDNDEFVCVVSRYLVVVSTTRTEAGQLGASADMQTHKFYSTRLSSWEGAVLVGQHWILMRCNLSGCNYFEMELVLDGYCQTWNSSFFTRLLIHRAYELMPWKIPWSFSFPLYICSCHAIPVRLSTSTTLPAGKLCLLLGQYSSCNQFLTRSAIRPGSQFFEWKISWYITWLLVELSCAHLHFGGCRSHIMEFTVKIMELQPTKIRWYPLPPAKPHKNYEKYNLLWKMLGISFASSSNLAVVTFKQPCQLQLLMVGEHCNAISSSEAVLLFSYRLLIEWPGVLLSVRVSFHATVRSEGYLERRSTILPPFSARTVQGSLLNCMNYCRGQFSWDPGIWAFLSSYYGDCKQVQAKEGENAETAYHGIDQVHIDCDYYFDYTCYVDDVRAGEKFYYGAFLNCISFYLDLSALVQVHVVHWDPGGSAWRRLGVKPNFKEGGLSATALPRWPVGRHSWAVACLRARRGGDPEAYIQGRQLRETRLGTGRTGRLRPRLNLAWVTCCSSSSSFI